MTGPLFFAAFSRGEPPRRFEGKRRYDKAFQSVPGGRNRICAARCTVPHRKGRGAASAGEQLRPVIGPRRIAVIAHTNGGLACIENVGAVPGAVHPALHHLLRRPLPPGDVFSGGAKAGPLFQ